MEDEKNHHNNNLLHLKLPSSSSSSSNQLLFTPPDSDTLLSLFNLPTYSLMNNSPFPSLISSHNNHQQPSFMGYGVQDQSADISLAGSFDNGENHTHPLISNAVMGGKRRKTMLNSSNKGEALAMEKTRDVIHVRAKRGQATDSHSLAERVRREKINEKLKVLQELVPGCYKTMGMAVVLDVIINYVRSLQNQIEFLSMKLSAASMFYDFNSPEAEAMEALQKTNPNEAMERMMMMRDEGFEEGANAAVHPTWPF